MTQTLTTLHGQPIHEQLLSVPAQLVPGHGVASGMSKNSPYIKSTIEMQAPFFEAAGVDFSNCFLGTLNLSIAPYEFDFYNPHITLRGVNWTDLIPPEDFSLSPCRLSATNAEGEYHSVDGWIYYPRPETKTVHFQPATMIEVVAPRLAGVKSGDTINLEYLGSQVRLFEPPQDKGPTLGAGIGKTLVLGFAVLSLGLFTGCTVTEIIGSNLQKNPEKRIEVGMQAATEYLKANDVENALRHINKVLELEPKNAKAHQTMALIYTHEQDFAKAERYYKLAIRYDKTLSSARNNYATLLYSLGRYDEAIEQLKFATDDYQYDNRAQAVQNLGLSYLAKGELNDAEASFQTALRLNPKLARSLLELSDILLQQKQYKLAARYLGEYSAVARHTPRSLWLGIQIEQVNGNEDALASYALALRNLFPNSNEYRRYMETIPNDK